MAVMLRQGMAFNGRAPPSALERVRSPLAWPSANRRALAMPSALQPSRITTASVALSHRSRVLQGLCEMRIGRSAERWSLRTYLMTASISALDGSALSRCRGRCWVSGVCQSQAQWSRGACASAGTDFVALGQFPLELRRSETLSCSER